MNTSMEICNAVGARGIYEQEVRICTREMVREKYGHHDMLVCKVVNRTSKTAMCNCTKWRMGSLGNVTSRQSTISAECLGITMSMRDNRQTRDLANVAFQRNSMKNLGSTISTKADRMQDMWECPLARDKHVNRYLGVRLKDDSKM